MAGTLSNALRSGYRPLLVLIVIASAFFMARLAMSLLRNEPLPTQLRRDWEQVSGRAARDQRVRLVLVGEGFERITDIQFVPAALGPPSRAVVLQKKGTARFWDAPAAVQVVQPGPPLLTVSVKSESEMGLLSLAFDPQFAGRFYVHYNPAQGARRTRIAEWTLDVASPLSSARETRVLLEVSQPFSNHKGGTIAFGPDRMLYIGLGDGGSAGDPKGNGQNPKSLLGKILRIDPTPGAEAPYTIPAGNLRPPQFKPEIWAYGLRNPWRFSFAPNGELIAGDVGQNRYEEIDWIRPGDNLGWNVREAGHCFAPEQGCRSEGLVDPIFEYRRELGVSVTGGFVYRGRALPDLQGKYIFADFESGRLWALPLP
ncbi:MAG TPA: PQQ-dependent sugar dehydrogenase, partial [Polyangiaceae bacterium]|nr:PQQ-dependent sugar dehydrogenase [Polyangiaceae bacterium]